MRAATRRVLTMLVAFALLLVVATPSHAQQTDSVQVSGEVVMAPLSLTIPDAAVRLGPVHQPHPQTGVSWLATGRLPITLGSPAPVIVTVCVAAHDNLHESRIIGVPELNEDRTPALLQPGMSVETCPQPIPWVPLNPLDYTRSFFVDLWMQPLDPELAVSATVTISLAM